MDMLCQVAQATRNRELCEKLGDLRHACVCKDANCLAEGCRKGKHTIFVIETTDHTKTCKKKHCKTCLNLQLLKAGFKELREAAKKNENLI